MAVDQGLQSERTELAWQRTALSALTGALVLFRLTVGRAGSIAIVTLMMTLPVTSWVLMRSRQRHWSQRADQSGTTVGGGRPAAGMAAVVVIMSLSELLTIVTS